MPEDGHHRAFRRVELTRVKVWFKEGRVLTRRGHISETAVNMSSSRELSLKVMT